MFITGLFYLYPELSGKNCISSLTHGTALSASQINNREDLINLLKKTNSAEARKEILVQNRDLVNKDLVITLLVEADRVFDKKYFLVIKESQHLTQIAVEAAEFTGDTVTLGKALLYYSIFERFDTRDDDPPSGKKALLLFKEGGDKRGEASCYYRQAKDLAESINPLIKTEKIFKLLDKALIISRERGDYLLSGDCFYMKGMVYGLVIIDKDKAIENVKKAIEIYQKEGDTLSIISSYQLMFDICTKNGLFMEEAKKYLAMKKQLIEGLNFDEIKDFSGKEDACLFRDTEAGSKEELMADYYYSLASICLLEGRYEEAIKYYQETIETAQKIRETCPAEIYAYLGLGPTYSILLKKDTTLKYYLEAESKITPHMDINLITGIYTHLAECYIYEMKEYDRGMEYYERALEKVKDIENPAYREFYSGYMLYNMGIGYNKTGNLNMAIKKFNESHDLYKKIYKDCDELSFYLIQDYTALSYAYIKKGDKEKAFEYALKAFNLSENQPSNTVKSSASLLLGGCYYTNGDLSRAIEYYKKALDFKEKSRQSRQFWDIAFSVGLLYEYQGNFEEAYNYFDRAIDIIEGIRQAFTVEELKRDFMQNKIEVYEHMIDILVKMKRGKDAFNYNEKARARAFLDILGNQKINIHHGVNQELLAKEKDLKTKIEYFTGSQNDEKLEELKGDYEEVLEQIKLENPEYMTLINVNPLTLEEIQSLLDKETVIIEYFLGVKNSYVWITGHDTFNSIVINHKSKDIENLVRAYRSLACDSMTPEKIKSNEWKEISEKLYDMIFKEGETFIAGRKRIIISPHRSLNYFPFQVLIDNKGKMLVEKYEITYLPSASILKYCKDKNHLKKDSLLAFELGNLKIGDFSPLPGTDKEIMKISKYVTNSDIYKGQDMTTDILYEKGSHYDILHFATHATLDSASPIFSSLLFADRTLPVYEIFDLNLKAYLVTLSACSTGLSEEANGDELTGLSRAFIYAGTPAVCVSLWDVSDVSTSDLMERFYFYLRDNNKAEALRLAQIDIMKKYNHPFFWAPFILTGDWI
jgi:CHAT domain-containing protein/Tfp pilus assembly protein PilF